ncbi:MAG: winged helix-turn-helix domain-containing protein [Chloracidobacterium sp.]|nr:winged helix-turn-helix domain-containing protein [Chloracidobacterium sp.]
MKDGSNYIFEFGPYLLDVKERRLLTGGKQVSLTPKAFDTLLMLVQNSGRVLEKHEMMDYIWSDCVVEEATLAQNIFTLRRVLGERVTGIKYIETVPKKGYRFIAEVKQAYKEQFETESHVKLSPPSIAILPFDSLLVENDNEYLGLGMADTLITKLSNVKQMIVRPTRAVRKYDKNYTDPVEIGKELTVDMVLNGAIQKAGAKFRVTVQLTKVDNSDTLWSANFDCSFEDIFAVQDSISEQIIRVLTPMLTNQETALVRKSYTTRSDAYLSYLKGRFYWGKWTREGIQKGIAFFKQAAQIDPDFAMAQAAIAEAYNTLSFYGYMAPKLAFQVVNQVSLKAIQLDPMLAEAHAAVAITNFAYTWDWATAEREFLRAIEINSGNPIIYHSYASFLLAMSRLSEASEAFRTAQKLDPLSPLINSSLAYPFYFAREYDQAANELQIAIEIDQYFPLSYKMLGDVMVEKGAYEKAITYYQKTIDLGGRCPVQVAYFGRAYALSGDKSKAHEIIRELESISINSYVSPTAMAVIYAGLDEKDMALEYLEEAYRERCNNLVFINAQPTFDNLRPDPRFTKLIQRMGLAP